MRFHPLREFLPLLKLWLGRGFAIGVLCGVYLVACVQPLSTCLGTSLPTTTAVAFALAVFLVSAGSDSRSPTAKSTFRIGWLHFCLAAWTVSLPWLLEGVEILLAALPESFLSSPSGSFASAAVAAAIVAGAPLFWTKRMAGMIDGVCRGSHGDQALPAFSIGIGSGILLDVFVLAPLLGLRWSGVAAATVGAGLLLKSVVTGTPNDEAPAFEPQRLRGTGPISFAWAIASAAGLGVAFAAVCCVLRQLLPAAAFVVWSAWAALPIGLGLGFRWVTRSPHLAPTVACLALSIWLAGVVAMFPSLVHGVLLLNAYVAWVDVSRALRGLLVFGLMLPIGISGGVITGQAPDASTAAMRRFSRCVPAFVAGWLSARWWLIPESGPAVAVVGAAWFLAVWGCVPSFRLAQVFRGRKPRAAFGLCLVAFVCAPFMRSRYDPAHAARLLFSTDVFVAHRQGEASGQLAVLNESRPLRIVHGREAAYTLWKSQGARLQLRADGVPGGLSSTDVRISPNFSGELLPVVLPIVLHRDAQHVLLLGLGAGTQVAATLEFPVRNVTCVESDPQQIELVRNNVWPHADRVSWENRLTLRTADPALLIAGNGQQVDVVVSNPGASSLWKTTPYFTAAFYRRVTGRLAEDGLFCQRFQQTDYGPQPLRAVVATLQSVFSNVSAFETAPGEIVLIATNADDGMALDGLVERLQVPHVRRALAGIGADWSFVLELPAYDDSQLAEFVAESPAGTNTTVNAGFAFALPREMMRWGAKYQQLQEKLSPHRSRLLEWIGEAGEDPDVLDRLAEAAAARRIKAAQSDQWWLYRKALREQVQERPRAIIQPVKHEGLTRALHPEDRRRLDYFRALSRAFEQSPPSEADIDYVSSFADPYDPLMSGFVHFEVARLYERAGRPDVRTESLHRLHTVYYADPSDRAVQNVAAAIGLLVDHSQCVPEPAERFDHINALLQVLKQRWNNRGGETPTDVDRALDDLRESITTAESALSEMDRLVSAASLSADQWQARRSYLERTLIRPLRTYRDRLQMHRRRPKPAE